MNAINTASGIMAAAPATSEIIGLTGTRNSVLLHQNDDAKKIAMHLWGTALRPFGTGTQLSTWSMTDLTNSEVAKLAFRIAYHADPIIVALRGHENPPSHLLPWLCCWMEHAKPNSTLIAVLGIPSDSLETTKRAHVILEQLAQRYAIKFLPMECSLPPDDHFASSALPFHQNTPIPIKILPESPEKHLSSNFEDLSPFYWGINE